MITSNMMIKSLVFITVCLSTFFTCLAQYDVACVENKDGVTFLPSSDGVHGRYTLECCTKTHSNAVSWESILTVDSRPAKSCSNYRIEFDTARKHSLFEYEITERLNCSNICLRKNLDLVYSGCYTIKNLIKFESDAPQLKYSLKHVENGLWIENFTKGEALVDARSVLAGVVIKFFFKNIPLTVVTVELCNSTSYNVNTCIDIEQHCEYGTYYLICTVEDLPSGRYTAYLSHEAPWTEGDIIPNDKQTTRITFDHESLSSPIAEVLQDSLKRTWLLSALGVCVSVCCVCVCVCVIVTRRGTHTFKGLVAKQWRLRYAEVQKAADAVASPPDTNGILLLYARDCEPFMNAINVLKQILAATATCKVYDLFEASTVCELSVNPAEWLRHCIESCNIILIETQTAQQLYTNNADELTLSSPLLGTAAVYKSAMPGDSYLQYCLRLIRDNAHVSNAYRKFYVARVHNMSSEVVPAVVPLTRYTLPQHTATLLQQLTSKEAPPELLLQLERCLHEFTEYVRDNPNYLKDELMFL